MKVTREDVLHCAKLTHIQLSEEEVEAMRQSMESILTRAQHLSELDLSNVQPITEAMKMKLPMRPDEIERAFTQAQALANAPDSVDGQFRVPKVL